MSYSRPVEKLNKNNDIAKKKEGRIWSRPGRPITFIPRGGLVNITGDARRRPRPVARYIYIYIYRGRYCAEAEMFPTASPVSVSTARYGDISRTNRVDSYKRSRWKGTIGIMRRIYFHPPKNSRNIGAVN